MRKPSNPDTTGRAEKSGVRARRVVARLLGFAILLVGGGVGTLVVAHLGFLLVGGVDSILAVWQNRTPDHFLLVGGLAIVLGGSIGVALGIWIWFLIMRRTRFIPDEEIFRIIGRERSPVR